MILDEQPFCKVYVGDRCTPSFIAKIAIIAVNLIVSAFASAVVMALFLGFETSAWKVGFVDDRAHQLANNYTYIDKTNIRLNNAAGYLLGVPVRYHSRFFGFTSDFIYFDQLQTVDYVLEVSARTEFPYRCNTTIAQNCAVFVSSAAQNSTMLTTEPTIHLKSGTGTFLLTEYSVILAAVLAALTWLSAFLALGKISSGFIQYFLALDMSVRVYNSGGFYRGIF